MSDHTSPENEQTVKFTGPQLYQLISHLRAQEVATLTAALISGRRKSISLNELLEITKDIQFAKYPSPNNPEYQEWEKTKEERLSRIYK